MPKKTKHINHQELGKRKSLWYTPNPPYGSSFFLLPSPIQSIYPCFLKISPIMFPISRPDLLSYRIHDSNPSNSILLFVHTTPKRSTV